MRALFFIEPVVFRNDPLMLRPWHTFCAQLAAASPGMEAHLATSEVLGALPSDQFISVETIDPRELLEPFAGDRHAYGRTICDPAGPPHEALESWFMRLSAQIAPEVVISWTENAPLRRTFGDRTMFMELGPLPSRGLRRSIHLDPFGHQVGSAFDRISDLNVAEDVLAALEAAWRSRWLEGILQEGTALGIDAWLKAASAGRSIVLLALQPPDWLTYEAIGPAEPPLELVRQLARRLEPGEVLLPTWHPAAPAPADADQLFRAFDNVLIAPPVARTNIAELCLPHVDRLVTVSSNVAACAALLGKGVEILGRAKFSALAGPAGPPRTDLLAFLTARYCGLMSDWLGAPEAFEQVVAALAAEPDSLFSPIVRQDLPRAEKFFD